MIGYNRDLEYQKQVLYCNKWLKKWNSLKIIEW